MKLVYFVLMSFILFIPAVNAAHVVLRNPASITTTVGELTTIQVDIRNGGTSSETYEVTITATEPNAIEITNPSITTTIKPGQSISVFTNIRTLTETSNLLTVQVFYNSVLHASASISVNTKKFSLPEFGLIGFLQIMALSSLLYFVNRRK